MPNIANKEGMTGYCKFDAKVSGKGSASSNDIKADSFGKKFAVGLSNAAKLDKVKQMCRESTGDSATYKGNEKLYATLGMQGQEVYLTHDDSWFQRGKNGFAVTEHGIYCCNFASQSGFRQGFSGEGAGSIIWKRKLV